MAGAGYKLFNTGDVLTAAQVNTYLQEQTVMVFADAAARTTALSGVLAEGMITYLKSTDAVEVYNGSAWVGVAGASSPLTTKGDLYTYSTTNARLAVGNNGDILVPDSSTSTGLRWQGNFAAGKNKIINGDFRINQRNFTSNTTDGAYNFDRFKQNNSGGTVTVTPQTFTAGTAPVAGYEAINFVQIVTASQSSTTHYAYYQQPVEDVRTLAGQTVTLSFWAKVSSGTASLWTEINQDFGSGGSSQVTTAAGTASLTTSWTRFSHTITLGSLSGKTIGTNNNLQVAFWLSAGSAIRGGYGVQNATFQIWGIQLEAGSTATAFQTATGTLAGELAACQRYYQRWGAQVTGGNPAMTPYGSAASTTNLVIFVPTRVPMRTTPSSLDYGGTLTIYDGVNTQTASSATLSNASADYVLLSFAGTGMTQYRPYAIYSGATNAYLGLNAEL